MKYTVVSLLVVGGLVGCGDDVVSGTADGDLRIEGVVSTGSGQGAADVRVDLAVFSNGCDGELLAARTLDTDGLGQFSTVFEGADLPSEVCVRGISDVRPSQTWDDVQVEVDSIVLGTDDVTRELEFRYDFALATVRSMTQGQIQADPQGLAFEIETGSTRHTGTGIDIIEPFRVGVEDIVSVTAQFSSSGGSAQLEKQLVAEVDRIVGFDIFLASTNVLEGCFGCLGKVSVPVVGANGETGDSLVIVWGSGQISQVVVN